MFRFFYFTYCRCTQCTLQSIAWWTFSYFFFCFSFHSEISISVLIALIQCFWFDMISICNAEIRLAPIPKSIKARQQPSEKPKRNEKEEEAKKSRSYLRSIWKWDGVKSCICDQNCWSDYLFALDLCGEKHDNQFLPSYVLHLIMAATVAASNWCLVFHLISSCFLIYLSFRFFLSSV